MTIETNNFDFADETTILDLIEDEKKEEKTVDLGRLTKLIEEQTIIERHIQNLEQSLKERQEQFREINERQIPDLFEELGLSEIKLSDGSKVSVDRSYAASITRDNEAECLNWLISNGHESIIKNEVVVKLKKGESEKYKELTAELAQLGLSYAAKQGVHPQTLKAFVREQIEGGKEFPMETFSVYTIRKTKIS